MRRGAAIALALLTGLAGAGCGSDGEGGGDGASSGATGPGAPLEGTIPAQIVDEPHGFVSTDVVRPLVNAWRAGGANSFTEVGAGALARDRSTGVLAIFRSDHVAVTQDTNLVEVPDAGPLRIVEAPTGDDVAASAQEDAEIAFEGADGIRGTLDLGDDSVELEDAG